MIDLSEFPFLEVLPPFSAGLTPEQTYGSENGTL